VIINFVHLVTRNEVVVLQGSEAISP